MAAKCVLLFATILCVTNTHALQCYVCSWVDVGAVLSGAAEIGDSGCKGGGGGALLSITSDSNYPNSPPICVKISATYNGRPYMVSRSGGVREAIQTSFVSNDTLAASMTVPASGCTAFGTKPVEGTICSCKTDKCNGNQKHTAAWLAVVMALVFSLLLK